MTQNKRIVSVIIPTIGRGTLSLTRAALERQTRLPDEIIVIEDKFRRGPSWARGEGFRQARGNYIVFTDDDCVPEDQWLEKMIDAMDSYGAAMVSSHCVESDPFLADIRKRRNFPTTVQINPNGFIGNTGNVIYRRDCLEDCIRRDGYIFNPAYRDYGCEDIDLVCRLRLRGKKLVFIDNKVLHLKQMTPRNYVKLQFKRGLGIGLLHQSHKNATQSVPDKSLLWRKHEDKHPIGRWVEVIGKKIINALDGQAFTSRRHHLIFLAGEPAQALGFLWCYLKYNR